MPNLFLSITDLDVSCAGDQRVNRPSTNGTASRLLAVALLYQHRYNLSE